MVMLVDITKEMINGQREQDRCPHTARTEAHSARSQGEVHMFGNDWNIVGVSFIYFPLFYPDYHKSLYVTVYLKHNYGLEGYSCI